MSNVPISKQPPNAITQSRQYDLFAQFFGDRDELSNSIELWDAIPKYSVTARRQNKLRNTENRLPVKEHVYEYRDKNCRLEIQPAAIKIGDNFVDFYPSNDEELIEEIIKKIFADQHYGLHDVTRTESWVKFSLQMIRRELKKRGKTRSLDEINRSIDILSKSHITLFVEGQKDPIYSASILADVTRTNRAKYLDDSSALSYARLPAMISDSVNKITYRQLNYGILMSLSNQLSRYIHRRLSHNYINASVMDPYTILYSTLKRDSGLLNYPRIPDNLIALESALDELKEHNVLNRWSKDIRKDGRKIDDVLYTFYAGMDFTKDIKAANSRLRKAKATLPQSTSSLAAKGSRLASF